MAQRRKSNASKAEAVTMAVHGIETSAKKQLGKINQTLYSEQESLKSERLRIKAELELVKTKDPSKPGWADEALGVADHMKSVVRRESEVHHQMLQKTDEVAKDLESRARPIKHELPAILDFSEEDRVHLNQAMDKALNNLNKKRKEIEEDEFRLQKEMSVLIHNTPDPSAPKEQVIEKLQVAYETIVQAFDPETLRNEVLANIAGNKDDAQKKEVAQKSKKPGSTKLDGNKEARNTKHSM
uniref:Laminin-like protein lam-2 n=1 Tax=Lygus hesperus TaxID=30085 RepID=A0A0A9Z0V5_LYGHE